MAIFKKDLENINEFNDRNRKIHTRSELLQFINLQNEASDYDFVDFKFELDINFKKRFDQHKTIFRNIANNRINQGDGLGVFLNLFNNGIFNKSLTDNLYIFSNLERLVYEVKEEDNLFKNDLIPISNSIKNSKKNRFDFIHSFLLNAFPNNITDNTVLTGPNSALSTVSKNLEYINAPASTSVFTIRGNNRNIYQPLQDLYKKIVGNPVEFLQIYTGLNFLKTDDFKLIKNHNKPLSLMTLATSINNIIENSFDYASCNSLFKGIYTEDELNSKLKVVDFTSVPFIETDVVKELLPIKYVDKFETINNTELKQLIKDFNAGINNNQNIRKVNNELISEDIFKFENFLCSEENIQSQINFTIKSRRSRELDIITDNQLSPTNKMLETIMSENFNDIVSIKNKTLLNNLECLSLIANHVNSNQIKLVYGTVNKINNQPDYSNIKYRSVIDTNKKGILNYKFEDVNNFTASIIKTRLICNNIVKSYKKYSVNKGYDASAINADNKMNYFLAAINSNRENIEFKNNALTLNDSIIRNNTNTPSSNLIESFNNQSHVFEIFKKTKNRINQNLIIINNSILGEMQADDFISSNPELNGVINLNRQINLDGINLDTITQSMNIKKNEIQTIINEYYNEADSVFFNTSTFFQKVKKICSDNLKWHLNKKNNTNVSSDRADILNNASILWLFNDSCKEMSSEKKEIFQDDFVSLLISYLYLASTDASNNLKNAYNLTAENIILNKGPTPSTITELAPFFSFFTTDMQNATNSLIRSKNVAIRSQSDASKKYNEYYNITSNTFETNGKSTHFLSIPAQLLEKGYNISHNSGHKLVDSNPLDYIPSINSINHKKKNIMLTGLNFYQKYNAQNNTIIENKEYFFIPQLTFKKIAHDNNQYKFEYFIYNAAMSQDSSNLGNANSYDLIQNLIDNFNSRPNIVKVLNQISYNFSTQNSFLNVLNFGNSYNVITESNALENNIFYQIINLFKNLIVSLNLSPTNNFSNFLTTQINNPNNKKIIDLKFMIKNTLKIASSIYSKMFNNLQSYTNLADRISESNFFYENSFDSQKLLKNIANGISNDADLKKYSKDMWQYYSNLFLNEPHLYTNFNINDFKKYRSFASKKFLYFLNEVLGIEKNEIELIMEKTLSFNLNNDENRNRIFKNNTQLGIFNTRHSRLLESQINGNLRREDLDLTYQRILNVNLNISQNNNLTEFMSNPFELFNLYNGNLFQLIPGLYNTIMKQDYQFELTPNLTIMNLFKAGNDLNVSYIQKQREYARIFRFEPNSTAHTEKEISIEEIINLNNSLERVGLLKSGVDIRSDNFNNFENNGSNTFFDVNLREFLNSDFSDNIFSTISREVRSNLIKAAVLFSDIQEENSYLTPKRGVEYDNFFDNTNIFINIIDYLNVSDEKSQNVFENKENYSIVSNLNSFNIFNSIIDNSFNLMTNYDTLIVNNPNSSLKNRVSGLKESYNYTQLNFIGLNEVIYIPQISLDLRTNNQSMLNQKYVDVNLNWYNHVLHGLITNDLGLAFSYDLLLYYYGNFVTDFNTNYQKLIDKRNTKITIRNQAMNISDVKTNLGKFTGIDRNLFELSTDNVKLQKNYIKSLIKAKSLENIINFKNAVEILTAGLEKFMEKIVSLDNQNENGDFFMSYFDDFYIKDLWHTLNTTNNANFLNKNYQRTDDNNNSWNIPNQAENVLGSHILTVGINNDYKLDKDDIVLIKVEMTDHDFPEIIWEPKVFEYCAAFEDIENVFLQHRAALKIQSINDITNQNPPIGINSSYLEFFIKESQSTEALTLKDSLIRNTTGVQNGGLNLNNNIGSINYTGDKSYLNPILYQNKFDEILNVLNLSNDDFIYSKLPYDFISNASQDSIKQVRDEIIKRCIHNQQMNLRLKKISKLLNGFEPNTEFSLSQNKWMQDMFVSSDIYDIFIEKFQKDSNLDNIKELYPFTYEEIKNAVKLNEYSYLELKFHKLHFTTNHKLNVYLQFMSDFTKALLPDFINLTPHNFQKIYTLAVNPKDFIVTGLAGGNNTFIPNSSELEFEKILYRPSVLGAVDNKILDELGTETSLILRLISNKTIERDNINYYSVKNKKTTQKYIPKNVSYRISTIIME